MIIKNITIENFQSYYGSQTLEFSEGLNLILGHGGKGKSKLFNAFYWVLFGKIYITGIGWCSTDGLPNSAKFAMQDYQFFNAKMLSDAQNGDKVKAYISLELVDDNGVDYRIERSVSAKRIPNEGWDSTHAWQVEKNEVLVEYESRIGTKIEKGIIGEDIIKALFPEGIRNYIWFQGESLDSLINFRNKETLKSAVKHISYYPFYEKLSAIITGAKSDIEKSETKKLRESNKGDEALEKVLKEKDFCESRIEREEVNKSRLEDDLQIIRIKLADDEAKMKGVTDYTGLNQEYNMLVQDEKEILNKLEILDNEQKGLVPNLWILRGIAPMINQCKEIIKNHTEFEDTAPEKKYLDNPGRTKLEEILETGQCFVCGSDASEGSDASIWIKKRLEEQEEYLIELEEYNTNLEFSKKFERLIGKIQDYPDSLKYSLDNIDKKYNSSEDEIDKLQKERQRLKDKKEELDKKIIEIKNKYGVDPIKEASQGTIILNAVNGTRKNLEKYQNLLFKSVKDINEYKSELKELEKNLDKLLGKKKGDSIPETEWKNISEFLDKICKIVKEDAKKDLLHKIESRANEFYQKFTEHDNGYKGEVKINDDYSIEYDAGLNTSHEDRKKMSIINAMLSLNQEALGIYYPFISDAPTSSFDIPTTHKYLQGIKDIFGQSIIMTKDVEIDSEEYKALSKENKVSRIYILNSEVYVNHPDPKLNEVSTKVRQLK